MVRIVLEIVDSDGRCAYLYGTPTDSVDILLANPADHAPLIPNGIRKLTNWILQGSDLEGNWPPDPSRPSWSGGWE